MCSNSRPSRHARTSKGLITAATWLDGGWTVLGWCSARLGSDRLGSDHLIAVFHWSLRFHPIARCDVAFISCHGAGSRLFAVRARYLPPARLVFYRTNRHLYIYIRILFMKEKMKRKRKRFLPRIILVSYADRRRESKIIKYIYICIYTMYLFDRNLDDNGPLFRGN